MLYWTPTWTIVNYKRLESQMRNYKRQNIRYGWIKKKNRQTTPYEKWEEEKNEWNKMKVKKIYFAYVTHSVAHKFHQKVEIASKPPEIYGFDMHKFGHLFFLHSILFDMEMWTQLLFWKESEKARDHQEKGIFQCTGQARVCHATCTEAFVQWKRHSVKACVICVANTHSRTTEHDLHCSSFAICWFSNPKKQHISWLCEPYCQHTVEYKGCNNVSHQSSMFAVCIP